ncbi:MAG: hypothetical protein RIM99_12625 [Cyclobacteriaceae bacterium]
MKKLSFILTVLLAVLISSCSEDDSNSSGLVDQLDTDSEAALESNFEDVDLITEASMETLDETDGGRSIVDRDALISCAIVEKDTVNKVITIDFGDGCEDGNGRIRKGKIIIEYNERKLVPGAYRIVTLEDFFIDEVQVEGKRTITNTSSDINDNPTFTITLDGGRLTFEDETTATRDATRIRKWVRANNPLQDEARVDGTASGTRRDGVNYTIEILEELVYKRACRAGRIFIPVSGIKQITWGDNVAVINYGDGDCDNVVTITLNGETFTKTLTPRGR